MNIDENEDIEHTADEFDLTESLQTNETIELVQTVHEIIDDYLHENILLMHEEKFYEIMSFEVTELLMEDLKEGGILSDEEQVSDVHRFVDKCMHDYFEMSIHWNIPARFNRTMERVITQEKKKLTENINRLRSLPQPEQRTSEWYEFRHQLITASSVGKVFGSESTQNSLIYEKCRPRVMENLDAVSHVNILSTFHHGHKYEPLSVMIYEHKYGCAIEDFGCIQHPLYNFIGASPDGINVNPDSERHGRMLEIKNIVNREITGNPLKPYWIQMQVQMETCDLDECDFLETRFIEYENEDAFYDDERTCERGVILHFVERISIGASMGNSQEHDGYKLAQTYSGNPHYVYMPLDIPTDKKSVEQWIETTRRKMRRSWSLYTPIYWYLDQYSCVLVHRNRHWFEKALPCIHKTWNTIKHERIHGYEHRAPKKRVAATIEITHKEENENRVIRNLPSNPGVCLVRLNHDEQFDNTQSNAE